VFEGRDNGGKGGSIDMFARVPSAPVCRVVALPAQRARAHQWYFQRYIEHLAAKGEIVLFDRSWYNRAGVEKVMGFCTPEETQSFLNAAPEFERHLTDDGILLFKYWLCCDQTCRKSASRTASRTR
jgi:polyphosphate kinase 2 (PPK2 family)